MPRLECWLALHKKEHAMRRCLRRKRWLKVAAAMMACGTLFQATTCSSTPTDMGEQLVTSVVDQWVASYFMDKFNVTGGFF